MNAGPLLELSVASILVNNIVLSRCIGVCPLCGAAYKLPGALGMGLSATVVMAIASALAWIIDHGILLPLRAEYLQIFVFVMVIVSLTLIAEMALQKLSPALHERTGVYLPMLASNCVVIAAALMAVQANPITNRPMTLVSAFVNGCATGVGYTLALVLMVAIRERLEYAELPRPLRGLPAAFLSAGLLSLAFLGFSGFHILKGIGG
jgi:electron transport complex protein RnfA